MAMQVSQTGETHGCMRIGVAFFNFKSRKLLDFSPCQRIVRACPRAISAKIEFIIAG